MRKSCILLIGLIFLLNSIGCVTALEQLKTDFKKLEDIDASKVIAPAVLVLLGVGLGGNKQSKKLLAGALMAIVVGMTLDQMKKEAAKKAARTNKTVVYKDKKAQREVYARRTGYCGYKKNSSGKWKPTKAKVQVVSVEKGKTTSTEEEVALY